MKRSILILSIALVLLPLCSKINASSLYLGLCDNKISDKAYSKTGSGTISAAVILPKSLLSQYSGAKIKGVRFALKTTEGISDVRGWIRNDLNEQGIDSCFVDTPVTGWNYAPLSKDLSVSGNEDIAVGFSFHQDKSTLCLSLAGKSNKNGYWIAKNYDWQDKSNVYNGSLSVELVIEDPNIPAVNLAINSATGDEITPYGNDYNAKVIVCNKALTTINGYKLVYDINGTNATTINRTNDIEFCQEDTVNISFPSNIVPKGLRIPVSVRIEADNDEVDSDNSATLFVSSYDESTPQYESKVLIEEFSTENCPNCLRAITTMETCMKMGYDKSTIQVTHHVGYKYDFLTVDADTINERFYGSDGTYAPGAMLDRKADPRYRDTSTKPVVPVFSVGYATDFSPRIDWALEKVAFVGLTPTVKYDNDSRTIDIKIDVERQDIFNAQCSEPRITLYVLQDSITHHHQAGITSPTFRHRHAFRTCLSDMNGDILNFDGNKAVANYTYQLPMQWEEDHPDEVDDKYFDVDPKYIEIVAFVNNYSEDINHCRVFNSTYYPLKELVENSAIENIYVDESEIKNVEYISLEGYIVNEQYFNSNECKPGVYIKRTTYTNGKSESVKVLKH